MNQRLKTVFRSIFTGKNRFVLSVVLSSLAIFLAARILFIFMFRQGIQDPGLDSVLNSLLSGIRFDLATLAIFNGAFFIFIALPFPFFRKRMPWKVIAILLVLLNGGILFFNFLDIAYFQYSSKRITHELFSMGSEATNVSGKEIMAHLGLIIGFLVVVTLYAWVLWRVAKKVPDEIKPHSRRWWVNGALQTGVTVALVFLTWRGGFQRIPLRISHAYERGDFVLGSASLNAGFDIANSLGLSKMKPLDFLPESEARKLVQDKIRSQYDGPFDPQYPLVRASHFETPPNRRNVVILQIESLNANYLGVFGKRAGKTITPFLDSLVQTSRLYTQYFSTCSRSIESLPAVLNSVPDIFDPPLIGSAFETNFFIGLANILSREGYKTQVFHGGKNGTLGLDYYSKVSGYQEYYGLNEFKGPPSQIDSYWGVFDEPYLQWIAEKQNSIQGPFLTFFFSLTNHLPYKLPTDEAADILAMDLPEYEKTVLYTDRALQRYFETARKMPWFANTYFLITGDHTFSAEWDPNTTMIERFQVPLILVGPDISPSVDSIPACHLGIAPTIIDLLKIPTQHSCASPSLLDPNRKGFAITHVMGLTTYLTDSLAITTNFNGHLEMNQWKGGKWEAVPKEKIDDPIANAQLNEMKGVYQMFFNTRLSNSVAPPPVSVPQ